MASALDEHDLSKTGVMKMSPELLRTMAEKSLRAEEQEPSDPWPGDANTKNQPLESLEALEAEDTNENDPGLDQGRDAPPAETIATLEPPQPMADDIQNKTAVATRAELAEMMSRLDEEKDSIQSATPPKPPTERRTTAPPPPPKDAFESHREKRYVKIFNDFIELRRNSGESTQLSYDKFVARLEKSRSAVMRQHRCDDVKFRVYEKNGKAALKVTPIGS